MSKATPNVAKSATLVQREEFEQQSGLLSQVSRQSANLLKELEYLKRSAELQKGIKPSFIMPSTSKTFDEMLDEKNMTLEEHMHEVSENIARAGGTRNCDVESIQKSLSEAKRVNDFGVMLQKEHAEVFKGLHKSMGTENFSEFIELNKSILGDPADPSAPGTWYTMLRENLSPQIQRIIHERQDATALMAVPTAITTSVEPQMGRLINSGTGWGKHQLGFAEGDTAEFGGGQISDRIFSKLYQMGVRARVTEYLIGNKADMLTRDPIAYERELRLLELILGKNHQIMYGNSNINKSGTTELEMPGIIYQMDRDESDNGYRAHIKDWQGKEFDKTNNSPLNIFRAVAEDLCANGRIPENSVTGRFKTLIDLSTANLISTIIDEDQRVLITDYVNTALKWGQSFSGFVTDLGVFNFLRSKTMDLTENDTWTPDERVSDYAPQLDPFPVTPTATPTAQTTEPKVLPDGVYHYYVTAVNDQGESKVSDFFANGASLSGQVMTIDIPYDTSFAGGTISGKLVTPVKHFNLYRANAGETLAANGKAKFSCIEKIPINGTSTTTYVDYDKKIPRCSDMFFISNDPRDIAFTSLVPEHEIPLYDISKGTTRQWMEYCIKGLNVWNPKRCYVVRNVPRFSGSAKAPW